MPEDEVQSAATSSLLTAKEIDATIRTLVEDCGIKKIRLTGGEPMMRRDFRTILENLADVAAKTPLELGITTNGLLFDRYKEKLKEAQVYRLNFSLDTLDPAKFAHVARRPESWFHRVRNSIDSAIEDGAFKVKINVVVMRGFNEFELPDFIEEYVRNRNCEVRFIEFMPFNANSWSANRMVPKAEILSRLEEGAAAQRVLENLQRPVTNLSKSSSNGVQQLRSVHTTNVLGGDEQSALIPVRVHKTEVAQIWKIAGYKGKIGIISSMTDQFCGGCNRLRLTADGQIKNCLFGTDEFDFRAILRGESVAGNDLTDQKGIMRQELQRALLAKHAALGGSKDMHEVLEKSSGNRVMVGIGG